MASGRQSDIGADTSRSPEARRIVDRRLKAQCGNRADTRHCHEPADLHIMTRQLVNLTVEIVDLQLDGLARIEQRPERRAARFRRVVGDRPDCPGGRRLEGGQQRRYWQEFLSGEGATPAHSPLRCATINQCLITMSMAAWRSQIARGAIDSAGRVQSAHARRDVPQTWARRTAAARSASRFVE
jgi:hypothetical protein